MQFGIGGLAGNTWGRTPVTMPTWLRAAGRRAGRGNGHHGRRERWRDSQRDNKAGVRGIQTTRYGWRDVYGRACETRPAAGADPAAAWLVRNPPAMLRGLPGGTRVAGDGGGAEFGVIGERRAHGSNCGVYADRVNLDGRLRVSPSEARRKRDVEPRLLPGSGCRSFSRPGGCTRRCCRGTGGSRCRTGRRR